MERPAWTDERLDDFRGYVEKRFDQVDKRFDQVDGRLDRMDTDIRELRREVHDGFNGLHRLIIVVGGGMMAGFLGVLATLLAQGA